MKRENRINIWLGLGMLAAFTIWTFAIQQIDVQSVGPGETTVGFATLNGYIHHLTGIHMWLYSVTDWLGLVPFVFVLGFGLLGLYQWIKRKHFCKVDHSILSLGVFYLLVMAVYVLFELVVINYRPVLINGRLEASYPSSTTMLVMCVMPTAAMQLHARIRNKPLKVCMVSLICAFTLFMVIGRLISGVHWITDIIGGALLSTGLVLLYRGVMKGK